MSQSTTRVEKTTSTDMLLAFYSFVFFAAPLMRIKVVAPIYAIDVCSFGLAYFASRYSNPDRNSQRCWSLSLFLLFSISLTSLWEIARIGFLEPTYLFLRTIASVLPIYFLPRLVTNIRSFRLVMSGMMLGVLVSGIITSLNALPYTGIIVRNQLINNPRFELLCPARSKYATRSVYLQEDLANRGASLVGGANVTACFLAIPLPILVAAGRKTIARKLQVFYVPSILAALAGIVLTYSRSGYLAVLGPLAVAAAYNYGSILKRTLPAILLGGIAVGAVGLSSGYFNFDVITRKMDFDDPTSQGTNMARIYSYTRPLPHVMENPEFLIVGAGRAITKMLEGDTIEASRAKVLHLKDAEMHAVFAASIYYRGLTAMVVIFVLLGTVMSIARRTSLQCKALRSSLGPLADAHFLACVAILPFWAFTHFLVTKLNGHMLVFWLFGTVLAVQQSAPFARRRKLSPNHLAATHPTRQNTEPL